MSERSVSGAGRVRGLILWACVGAIAVATSATACNRAPLCMPNETLDPRARGCVPNCGTPEAPISRDCFDQDSGMIREGGVAADAREAGPTDASDAGDVVDASESDADATAGDADPCGPGREMVGGECDVKVPRAIAPLSTARVTSRTPRLKWVLPAGVTSAHVEVCADRLCARLLAEGDASNEWMPPSELPSGVAFWRVRGVVGGARSVRTSPTWWMWVPARSAAGGVQSSWGSVPDVNGDGLGDVVACQADEGASCDAGTCANWRCIVAPAAPGVGVDLDRPSQTITARTRSSGFGSSLATTDVNGDGLADVVIGEPFFDGAEPEFRGAFHVYLGARDAVLREHFSVNGSGAADLLGTSVVGIGDVNADGFGDVAVSAIGAAPGGATVAGQVAIYFGAADGLSRSRVQLVQRGEARRGFGWGLHAVGDVNGDNIADLVIADSGSASATRSPANAFLYLGSARGLQSMPTRTWTDGDATTTFGVGGGGADFNNDGYADVWLNNIFLKGDDTGVSRIDVMNGGPSGPGTMPSATIRGTASAARPFERYESGLGIGGNVADVNRDGFDDLVARVQVSSGTTDELNLRLFRGSASGIQSMPSPVLSSLGSPFVSETVDFAVLGDVSGDGIADFAAIRAVEMAPNRVAIVYGTSTEIESSIRAQRPASRLWVRVLSAQ
ncbi:MAG: FG-GAP repeat protein [Myxococcales bacterium]|nr:FG-GAP repeat protein [Myxococcales bacterium]